MCVLKTHPHQHNETIMMKMPNIFLIRYLEMMLPKKSPQPSIVLDKNNEIVVQSAEFILSQKTGH